MEDGVNEHYLNHVVETGRHCDVQASEDIVAGNGMKLLAKGAVISAAARERLLAYKLAKPLEECIEVVGGVTTAVLARNALQLLDEYGLVRALCADARAQPVDQSLARLPLTAQMLSLVTVYGQQPDRLAHATGVAMIAQALARRLYPGDVERHRLLARAGLVHDIGELYIDPQLLGRRLATEQWKHVATHPLVGQRVLAKLDGAGKALADAVLQHHERLDGFGYPRGIAGVQFTMDGQILAAAEWLMGLIESGAGARAHASVARKLIPGEFSAPLIEALSAAARNDLESAVMAELLMPLDEVLPRIKRVAATLERFRGSRPWIDEQIEKARPALRALLEIGLHRMLRIQAALSSTGLDLDGPEALLEQLEREPDHAARLELAALVREFGWRMQELERESMLRASQLDEADHAVMAQLMARMKGLALPE